MEKFLSIPVSRRDFMKLATLSAAGMFMGKTLSPGKAEAAGGSFDFTGADLPVICEVDTCVAGGGAERGVGLGVGRGVAGRGVGRGERFRAGAFGFGEL